ncbi:MAG TPA: signal recognition particle-docking protein FtsY [Burkholderiales bacterium]|nr:signal recognition particle-docking protein FtsY [Burkholderiales bacterium]
MDTQTLIAVIASAVVLLGLVLFLAFRRRPQLPEATSEREELPSTGLPRAAEPPREGQPLQPAERVPSTKPAAPEAAAHAEPEAAEPAAPVESQHDKDVAAIRKGLANTRGGLIARLAKLFGGRSTIDQSLLDEIEEVLITSDVGVKTSERILTKLREQMSSGELTTADGVWKSLRELAVDVLAVPAKPIELSNKPSLIMIVGVNGAGKTTTIGKLAARYVASGRKVLLAAGDTFRAAAVFQLEVWAKRVNCPVVTGKEGADPGAVIFDAVKRAQAEGFDLVIADTAGRLHTKVPLMEELKKVDRTAQKALGGRTADEILLVLDATTGQNAVQQMHMFREALQVSGVVLTKLDGTAKGGMILGIVDEHRVPVRFIGLGERLEDLREFDAESFVEALFAKPDGEILAA